MSREMCPSHENPHLPPLYQPSLHVEQAVLTGDEYSLSKCHCNDKPSHAPTNESGIFRDATLHTHKHKEHFSTVQFRKNKENINGKKTAVNPPNRTLRDVNGGKRRQEILSVMSNKSQRPWPTTGVKDDGLTTKVRSKVTRQRKGTTQILTSASGKESHTSTKTPAQQKMRNLVKTRDLPKLSSQNISNRRYASKSNELLMKANTSARRDERSSCETRAKVDTKLAKESEPRHRKISPFSVRIIEEDMTFLLRPLRKKVASLDGCTRSRSESEPIEMSSIGKRHASSSTRKHSQPTKKEISGLLDSDTSLPRITIDEVLQSWKVTPSRGRAGTLSADPMEFLKKDRSLSPNPENTPTYDDLKKCRYLRVGKSDESHEQHCSCNSCEHIEGLKRTAYMNS